jgi:hypothetical protein
MKPLQVILTFQTHELSEGDCSLPRRSTISNYSDLLTVIQRSQNDQI